MKDKNITEEEIAEDLTLLVSAGLVDIAMREDGEWIYSASEYSKTLTEEQIMDIIISLSHDDDE